MWCVYCVLYSCTAHSTHNTTWKTCCHNTALLITMYLYWLFLQKGKFSQAQRELPEDGPNVPKHVGANIRHFNVNFNISCCTAPSTHTATWNTCCHNAALLITVYLYWLFLQMCNFSQAQCKLPENGPGGPKHVGANISYLNVNFNILYG